MTPVTFSLKRRLCFSSRNGRDDFKKGVKTLIPINLPLSLAEPLKVIYNSVLSFHDFIFLLLVNIDLVTSDFDDTELIQLYPGAVLLSLTNDLN